MSQFGQQFDDSGEEKVLRLYVVGVEGHEVEVRQCLLGKLQCPIKELRIRYHKLSDSINLCHAYNYCLQVSAKG